MAWWPGAHKCHIRCASAGMQAWRFLMEVSVSQSLEWCGVITAIVYSPRVALNISLEFMGFRLLLVSFFDRFLDLSWQPPRNPLIFRSLILPRGSSECCVGFRSWERRSLFSCWRNISEYFYRISLDQINSTKASICQSPVSCSLTSYAYSF